MARWRVGINRNGDIEIDPLSPKFKNYDDALAYVAQAFQNGKMVFVYPFRDEVVFLDSGRKIGFFDCTCPNPFNLTVFTCGLPQVAGAVVIDIIYTIAPDAKCTWKAWADGVFKFLVPPVDIHRVYKEFDDKLLGRYPLCPPNKYNPAIVGFGDEPTKWIYTPIMYPIF